MCKNAENVNYEELIKERDKLIKEVRALEREVMRDRSNDCKLGIPPVIPYIATLNQLGMLCLDMAEKYNGKRLIPDSVPLITHILFERVLQ